MVGFSVTPQEVQFLVIATALIFADALLGAFLAMKQRQFRLRYFSNFAYTGIVPYVGSLLVILLLSGVAPPEYKTVFYGLFLTVAAVVYSKYLTEIKDKLLGIFGKITFDEVESRK